MRFIILALALAAVATNAGAQTAAKPPAKAAPKPAAAKPPVSAKAPAKAAAFDARDPASMVGFLATTGAKAEAAEPSDGAVFIKVDTPGGGFGAQFVGCDAKGRICRALVFSAAFDRSTANVVQINGFNRTQVLCRAVQSESGKPNIAYSTLLSPHMTTDDMKLHVSVWQGCLTSFGEFSKDPAGFLVKAP